MNDNSISIFGSSRQTRVISFYMHQKLHDDVDDDVVAAAAAAADTGDN